MTAGFSSHWSGTCTVPYVEHTKLAHLSFIVKDFEQEFERLIQIAMLQQALHACAVRGTRVDLQALWKKKAVALAKV